VARIRTVKPDFFRHELLQDLELTYPGKYPMLVFEGLWGHCDKAGRFEWRPRHLKLDILPFLPFEMAETLAILEKAGMLKKYTVDGKEYGEIPSFTEHQRIGGKESQEPEKHPAPTSEAPKKKRGSNREAPGKQQGLQEGKGREGNKEGNGDVGLAPDPAPQGDEKKPKDVAKEILIFLNEKTGRNYEPVDANLELIIARLKDGASALDLRQVVAKKSREWLADEKMAEYLRPKTLFNRTNFAQYKGELVNVASE
jgi:uncharacterized phage protein (TIGR02220 family)